MKKSTRITATAVALVAAASLHALTVEVQKFVDGETPPAGYVNVADGVDAGEAINVSADPYVDYLIPNNSGSAGITAQKNGGVYIVSSTVAEFPSPSGANNGIGTDTHHVVFEWEDGTPLPFGADFFGVSWSNWSATSTATLTTRIDLVGTDEITVYHWFNDGWNYEADGSGHDLLDGHNLTVTQYNADGTEVSSEAFTLSSGGAEGFFGDHRQFYSSIITATATADGDYLIIVNEGGNVGYKGTAVALLGGGTETWNGYALRPDGYVDTTPWMGFIYAGNADAKWVWNVNLGKWIYVNDASGWVYVPQ